MMRDHDALIALLDERGATPFSWWGQDCVTFASACVKAQTGVDLVAGVGSRWTTARGAGRVLRRQGGLEEAVDRLLPAIATARAARGDVGLALINDRPCLVIFEGATVVGPGLNGLVRLPREAARRAWSADPSAVRP